MLFRRFARFTKRLFISHGSKPIVTVTRSAFPGFGGRHSPLLQGAKSRPRSRLESVLGPWEGLRLQYAFLDSVSVQLACKLYSLELSSTAE